MFKMILSSFPLIFQYESQVSPYAYFLIVKMNKKDAFS